MAGRDRAVAVLAANYASLREEEVLALKVTRRYRLLMQVLHEDSLRRLLPLDEFEAVRSLDFLGEVAGLAAEARRFLEKRRARELDVDDALAEELAFERSVRTRRLRLVRAAMMPAAGSTAAASGQPAPHASSSAAG
ncbi:MAG: hypothetical protein BWZ02_03012 [Lentisphaerae bacterium ADurb.BinA184]|nr:MAG: hypothetical protein BWZ02_03012 [Lentisphaerae bacterium ADurb.BinA184]